MRNVFLFVWKNHFTFLFLVLEIFCFYLLFQNNRFHKAGFINSSNRVSGSIIKSYSNITDYFSLGKANEQLAQENANFHENQKLSFYSYTHRIFHINDTIFEQQYEYIPAKVINNSVNKRNNYITLNRGSNQGIEPNMGVISPNGFVGVVASVSGHFSVVLSLLHKNSSASVKLLKNNYAGVLEWDGKDPEIAILKDIPGHVNLVQGDSVVTTSYSAIFPEGIMIGTVKEFELNKSSNFYNIQIQLSTGFRNLHHVYVVKNLLKTEQIQLEEHTADAK